jgi:pimeloyl-ACP methyl ester carboxylesterase
MVTRLRAAGRGACRIPGAGHFLHLEQPKTVADHILGFLNS